MEATVQTTVLPGLGIAIFFNKAQAIVASHAATRVAVRTQNRRLVAPTVAASPDVGRGQGSDPITDLLHAGLVGIRLVAHRARRTDTFEIVIAINASTILFFQTTRIFLALINV